MTNSEAAKCIEHIRFYMIGGECWTDADFKAMDMAIEALQSAPSTSMSNLIDRQAAIDALWKALYEYEDKTEKQFQESEDLDLKDWILHRIFVQNMNDIDRQTILNLPSAQPERLTDDDFETIRIHLSAIKETLCNQQRWEEAEEYQRIIDRFMAFASALPEKTYTKADYIMALHKEYGCSLTRAEEAHNKALEYLQEEMMMRGGKNERREREGLL